MKTLYFGLERARLVNTYRLTSHILRSDFVLPIIRNLSIVNPRLGTDWIIFLTLRSDTLSFYQKVDIGHRRFQIWADFWLNVNSYVVPFIKKIWKVLHNSQDKRGRSLEFTGRCIVVEADKMTNAHHKKQRRLTKLYIHRKNYTLKFDQANQ